MHTAKRGPRAAAAAPVSRPQRGARIRRTPLPNASPPLSVSPLPEDTRPHPPVHQTPARAHTCPRPGGTDVPRITQNTSRATYGSRVLSNMVSARAALRGRQTRHPFHDPGQGLAMAPSCSSSQPGKSSQGRTGAGRRSDGRQWRPGTLPSQVPQPLGRGRNTRVSAAAALRPQALLGRPWLASSVRWPDPGALSSRRGVWTRALRMRTGREEERGLGPSRGATRDPPAPGLVS